MVVEDRNDPNVPVPAEDCDGSKFQGDVEGLPSPDVPREVKDWARGCIAAEGRVDSNDQGDEELPNPDAAREVEDLAIGCIAAED